MLSPQALRGDQGQLGSRPLPEPLRPQGKAPPASRRQPRPLPFIIPHDCGRRTEVILRAGRDALKNRPKWGNALSAGKQRKSPQWDVRSELVPGGWRPQSRSRGGPASKLREGWDAVTRSAEQRSASPQHWGCSLVTALSAFPLSVRP